MNTQQSDVLLTPAEAAAESRFSIETIRQALRSDDPQYRLVGYQPFGPRGRIRIPRSELARWLSRTVTGEMSA
jgi:hypothetical protein